MKVPKVALLVVSSVLVALGIGEGALRWALFQTSFDFAAKDPAYYARTADELWIYRHLFSARDDRSIGGGRSADSRIPFYRDWAASLGPDALLGYARKPNVTTPCHETTSVATRGVREPGAGTSKIAFFGDSFVESAACSDDTLATKLEGRTGREVLNFGVGGYGLDQMVLLAERTWPALERDHDVVLVGLIQDDLDRVLLTVREAPKPYFTLDGHALALHTDHIHPESLADAFVRPSERSYLVDFLRGRFGTPVYRADMRRTRDERRVAMEAITRRLFDRLASRSKRSGVRVAMVVLPQPGLAFDATVLRSMRDAGLPVVDLQTCLRDSRRPDTALYAELHPTSLGNDLLADCLAAGLASAGLLP